MWEKSRAPLGLLQGREGASLKLRIGPCIRTRSTRCRRAIPNRLTRAGRNQRVARMQRPRRDFDITSVMRSSRVAGLLLMLPLPGLLCQTPGSRILFSFEREQEISTIKAVNVRLERVAGHAAGSKYSLAVTIRPGERARHHAAVRYKALGLAAIRRACRECCQPW